MGRLIDDWGFRYPGVQRVDHVYFYAASSAPPDVLQGYLRQARRLGRTFAHPADVGPAPSTDHRPTATVTAPSIEERTTS
jgi:NAD(P)H dehydrogenase (quinone)